MRILNDFKLPNFKFSKIKMENIEDIENMKVDYEKVKEAEEKRNNKKYQPYETTDYKTIKEVFISSTEKYANNPLILEKIVHKEPYKVTTYREFGEDVVAFGTALLRFLPKNPRVVIIGETTYGWYLSYMALLCGAGIAVPVDKELPDNELENIIKRAKATAVIYTEKKKDTIKRIESNVPNVKYFIQMNSDDCINGKHVGINHFIKEGKEILSSGDTSYMDIEIEPEEFKVLIFTSGTTAKSKGVMICNRNLAANINAVFAYIPIHPTDRLFSILPLHHTYESTIGFLVPFAAGASIAICEGLKYIVPGIQEAKPTVMLTVPVLLENLYKKINESIKKSKKEAMVNSMIHITNVLKVVNVDIKRKVFKEILDNLGGNVRLIVSAAAPIDAKVAKWIEDIGIKFAQGYGLTETAPMSALTPEYEPPRFTSTGKAVKDTDIKVLNPNENGEGELLIKGPTVMLGYYEDEEATKEVMKDGYFCTGDIGKIDEDGYIYITGRSKNVIVTQNGKNIYPEEIESMIDEIPEVTECMVYGKKEKEDKHNKELIITAKVIPNYKKIEELDGKDLSDEEIEKIIWEKVKLINKKLTSYKAVRKIEIKKEDFEKTSTMKIKRYAEICKDEKK
jgi:long-chain acyl-CoA synthetase